MSQLPRSNLGRTIAEYEAEGHRWVYRDPPQQVEVLGDDEHWHEGLLEHWQYSPREGWRGYVSSPGTPGFSSTCRYLPAGRMRPRA